ncbi:MAG: polyphosphate kinase 2 family protein [Planctomycetes bacterium]|nr:polyphosphate kinase 2 family protein [Planctomycetota bacterium]
MPTFAERFLVAPGKKLRLADIDPRRTPGFDGDKDAGKARTAARNARLEELQELLYANGTRRLLVVLQAMDAGGKDGTIRSVFDGVNPQGVKVACFKKPTDKELAHDFLWRCHPHAPAAGEIAIWNRSHYEDVLVSRVHDLVDETCWRKRYEHIVAFESMLADEGTTVRKFFLHISKDEQRERLQARIDDPKKRWKWSSRDLDERRRWDDYQAAYEEALAATSTAKAPWYVVPADRNWFRDLVVSEILVETLEALDLRLPPEDPDVAGLRVT